MAASDRSRNETRHRDLIAGMRRRRASLPSLFADAMMLGLEAHAVVTLRGFGFMTGQTTAREAALMMSEKAEALVKAQTAVVQAIANGNPEQALPAAVAIYRRAARANRRRLSHGK